MQIADGRKADCALARATSREHEREPCVCRGRGTRHCVCSNVSISITTPQRQSPHNIGRAGLLPALRVREILIINNGHVPSQGVVRREGCARCTFRPNDRGKEREEDRKRERERPRENRGDYREEQRRK